MTFSNYNFLQIESETQSPGVTTAFLEYRGNAPQYFESAVGLYLESGVKLPSFTLAYHTYGTLNTAGDNVVWIVHALTANSDPQEWWPEMVGPGKYIDPVEHFIICANALGSSYGSTSPISINPQTGEKYYHQFPLVTQRDQVAAFDQLRLHLGIKKVKLLVGASLGGQQCLEWSILRPHVFEQQLLIATNAVHSPWGIAFNEAQRMAIFADPSFDLPYDDGGKNGLAAARAMAMISYRTYQGYGVTQAHPTNEIIEDHRASTYQRYQGHKLVKRFNAHAYVSLSRAMDSHNIGRRRGPIPDILDSVTTQTHIIGIDTDILFPLSEQAFMYNHINRSKFHTITSRFGHDGFLTEGPLVGRIVEMILK
jgi:homoserine O-acetyltransferase/O-succinyltransferase